MHHLGTDIGSLGPCQHEEEQIVSVHVLLMTRTVMSHNSGILASEGNSVSFVQADDNRNMSSALDG